MVGTERPILCRPFGFLECITASEVDAEESVNADESAKMSPQCDGRLIRLPRTKVTLSSLHCSFYADLSTLSKPRRPVARTTFGRLDMYCQSCGNALTHKTKFCNRCGTQLVAASDLTRDKTPAEKRLDEYLDGLFWISVFGLAFIIGGTVILKKIEVRDLIVVGYAILSTVIFLINFGFSLWGALSLMRSSKDGKLTMQPGHDTRELGPPTMEAVTIPVTSVTENTTRSFEPLEQKRARSRPTNQPN